MAKVFARENQLSSLYLRLRPDQRFLVLALLVLQALDVATTAMGLRIGLWEGNGFAAGIMAGHGELAAYGLKTLVTLALLGAVLLLHERYSRLWLALRIVSIYMFAVVAFNLLNIALQS